MNIVAVIPARQGSKGIANKNIKEIGGQPLISYAILDALRMKEVDNVFVSTDSLKIKKIAEKYGAEVPFMRPSKYSQDNSSDSQWVGHFIAWYKVIYDKVPDYIVHLRATTPLRRVDILDEAITTLKMNPQATALRSVELFAESPYKWVKIDKEGYFKPLLNDDKEAHIMPRQKYPNVYRPNGYIDIYDIKTLLSGTLCGDKILAYITPRSVEIDDSDSFELAEAVMRKPDTVPGR